MVEGLFLRQQPCEALTQRSGLLLRCGVEHLGSTRPRLQGADGDRLSRLDVFSLNSLHSFQGWGRSDALARRQGRPDFLLGVDLIFALTAGSFLTSCFHFRGQKSSLQLG